MKNLLTLTLILSSTLLTAQELCFTDILDGEKLKAENVIEQYLEYDFSDLWMQEKPTLGIIGDNYQRLHLKFLLISKNENSPNEYLVYGRSKVRNNICDFVGKITIEKIQEVDRERLVVDNEYKNKVKCRGIVTARYEFFENKMQKHAGIFSGILRSKWFLDYNNRMNYDDVYLYSDLYFNNSFVGVWKMYNSELKKVCNWADYRVPNVLCDFDCGVGDFNVSDKYLKNGWENYKLINEVHSETEDVKKARKEEKEWWK